MEIRHARIITAIGYDGLIGAAELKYRGCDAPRATADGAGSTFNNVGISAPTNDFQCYAKVSGNAGKRGMGESKILPELSLRVVIVKPAGGRGHDGGAGAVLGPALLVQSILPRCV